MSRWVCSERANGAVKCAELLAITASEYALHGEVPPTEVRNSGNAKRAPCPFADVFAQIVRERTKIPGDAAHPGRVT